MIEEALVTLLSDTADIYPAYLPEKADRPAIVYRRVSTNRLRNHDGPTGDVEARFQFAAHADTHPEALELARAIVRSLNGRLGSVAAGDNIELIDLENELDLGYEPDAEGWEYTLDAIIKYKE